MQIFNNSPSKQKIALIVSVFASLMIRIPALYYSSYWWRAVQTELTAYWFGKEGINLLNYQTPLYGPPWQIPLEFPLFQATAAFIAKIGLAVDMVFACRLTALLYFYLSAAFLYLVCREIFSDRLTNFVILTIYLWLPYNIHFSTEPLIDYLALASAFGYLYYILLWIKSDHSIYNTILAIFFGIMGILVKPNTMPVVVIPIVIFVLMDMTSLYRNSFTKPFKFRLLLNQRSYWFSLGLMAISPLVAASLWTRHSDHIKASSIFTQWLTSSALISWNFGTWELRSNPNIWVFVILVIQKLLLPYGLLFFGILGLYIAFKERIKFGSRDNKINLFILSISASSAVILAIFINLYIHDYYYISLSASTAIVAGYGIIRFWQSIKNQHRIFKLLFVLLIIVYSLLSIKDYKSNRTIAIYQTQKMQQSEDWAQKVQEYIPVNDWVAFIEYDWNPTYFYSLERKVMVITPRELDKPLCKLLSDEHFSLVIIGDPEYSKNEQLLTKTLSCFKFSTEVMPGVYQVKH